MQEENKYYMPQIEEFYVGFEYEWSSEAISAMLRTRPTPSWQTKKVENFTDLIYLEADLTIDLIRVKYLDSQDIIDLGWTVSYTNDKYLSAGISKEFTVGDSKIEELTLHFDYLDNTVHISALRSWETITFFMGTIKNKSELSRIMNMLGICKK
jgi:hypothetical protein